MRNILAIGLFIIACLFVVSCKEEDTSLQGKMGYLRLDVATVSSTNTKSAVPENIIRSNCMWRSRMRVGTS